MFSELPLRVDASGQNEFIEMRVCIVHESIEHEKWDSMRGRAAFYNQPFLSYVFVESLVLFFGQNKYTNIRFRTIFRHEKRAFILAFKKYKKIQS